MNGWMDELQSPYWLGAISGESIIAVALAAAGSVDARGIRGATSIASQTLIDVIAPKTVAAEARLAFATKSA